MNVTAMKRKTSATTAPRASAENARADGAEDRHNKIAVVAYYKAEARGFTPGHETQDWLDAETQVLAQISGLNRSAT